MTTVPEDVHSDTPALDTDQVRVVLGGGTLPGARQVPAGVPQRGRRLSAAGAPAAGLAGLSGAQSQDPPAAPPRYNANNVSQNQETSRSDPESADKEVRQGRRSKRYGQREVLWALTNLDRVRKCGRATNGIDGAAIVMNGDVAHWSGFCSCGSIWACPVCSAKIRVVRADEIARAAAKHIKDGGTAWMVTLTARHKKSDDLEKVFDAVANGWRRLMSGRVWAGDPKRGVLGERDKLGVRGNIRSLEVTWGSRNGFHPHLHVLLLLNAEEVEELTYMMARWDKTWRAWMKKHGYEPSRQHGVNWSKVTSAEEAGEYIAKLQEGKGLGNEMARGDMKSGRLGTVAPFELLEYFRQTGDTAVIPVWHEYERGTFNRRAITWSNGLRKELLPKEEEKEKTGEEIANEEVGGREWAILRSDSLRAMRRVPGLQARLLDVAENGGFKELVDVLTVYHLTFEIGSDAPSEEADGSSDEDAEPAISHDH